VKSPFWRMAISNDRRLKATPNSCGRASDNCAGSSARAGTLTQRVIVIASRVRITSLRRYPTCIFLSRRKADRISNLSSILFRRAMQFTPSPPIERELSGRAVPLPVDGAGHDQVAQTAERQTH
jgi:hypothetical protein